MGRDDTLNAVGAFTTSNGKRRLVTPRKLLSGVLYYFDLVGIRRECVTRRGLSKA
jgi:hypothetical protein